MADTLPEGTDHILPGAENPTPRDRLRADAADLRDKATSKAEDLRDQAADKARSYAEEGKARASAGLDSFARMIGDGAAQIDERLGSAYGDYARKAGDAVSDLSSALRDRNVDELFEDARDLVRRSPAIAIGAAAAAGFFIARIVKAGSETLEQTARDNEPAPRAPAPARPRTTASKPAAKRKPRAQS